MFRHLLKDFNAEYAKGGGGGGEAMMMMMMQQQQQEREAQRTAEAKATQDRQAEQARLEQEKQANIQKSRTRVNSAYDTALTGAKNKLHSRGLADDAYGIMDLYKSELNRVKSGLPEIVDNANDYFTPSLWDNVWGDVRTNEKRKLGQGMDEFIGDGFDYNTFADTADDSILDGIIGDQYGDSLSTLQRALARGTINDAGMGYATKKLDQQKTAGRAKAEDMGLGVLQGYRTNLKNTATGIRGRLNNWDLGDALNLDTERTRVNDEAGRYRNRMEGDILNAIGDTSFFDTDTILGKAGQASGVMNNPPPLSGIGAGASPLLQSFGARTLGSTDDDPNKRNAGSAGVF